MKTWFVAAGLAIVALPSAAFAQGWTPGSEIVGQQIQVTTNGTTNTLVLNPGGTGTITTPGGNLVPATWSAANGQLCLGAAGAQECVPYASPFQAGQPLTLTSSCNSTSTWLAQATNQAPTRSQRGERGQ
ncbi:MAG: hypothetical protein V4502_00200 [Pseudomonadota bacterium]